MAFCYDNSLRLTIGKVNKNKKDKKSKNKKKNK